MSHVQKTKGEVLLQFIAIFSVVLRRHGFQYNSFEVMVLHITLSREKRINDKSPMMFVATVYRPPGHHTDFIKEFGDFLLELELQIKS